MIKLLTALVVAASLLAPATATSQNTQELPAAPTPVQPRFPGAPAQAPAKTAEPAASQSTGLTSLPPAQTSTPAAQQSQPSTQHPAAQQQQPAGAWGGDLFPSYSQPDKSHPQATEGDKAKPQDEDVETGDFRIGVSVDLVNLIFTATDKHGHFIKNLKQQELRLLDEGKPPLRIDAFESETNLPLRVGLLVDASNSIRDRFRFEQDAAVEFLNQVVRPNTDRAFVIGFDSMSELTQDFTDNTNDLAHGVRVLRPGGGTALHDAVYAACEKLTKAPVKGPARRAIILLSDGDDNQSRRTREEAIEEALRAEAIIYVISTNIGDENRRGDKVLMRYAEATGGRVFFPLRIQEVNNAFAEIQDELRSQYVLAYKPSNFVADGRYRAIALDAPGHSNIKIRVRKGYYAPKSQ